MDNNSIFSTMNIFCDTLSQLDLDPPAEDVDDFEVERCFEYHNTPIIDFGNDWKEKIIHNAKQMFLDIIETEAIDLAFNIEEFDPTAKIGEKWKPHLSESATPSELENFSIFESKKIEPQKTPNVTKSIFYDDISIGEDLAQPVYCFSCAKIGIATEMNQCWACKSHFHKQTCSVVNNDDCEEKPPDEKWRCDQCTKSHATPDRTGLLRAKQMQQLMPVPQKSAEKTLKVLGNKEMKINATASIEKASPAPDVRPKKCVACEIVFLDYSSIYCSDRCIDLMVQYLSLVVYHNRSFIDVSMISRVHNNKAACTVKLRKLGPYLKLHRDLLPVAVDLQAFRTYLKRPALQKTENSNSANTLKKNATKPIESKPKPTPVATNGTNNGLPGFRVDKVRISVRTLLRDALCERARDLDEILLSSDEIKSLAIEIERQMYSAMQGDVQGAYKRHFKSLLMLLKDKNSSAFARRVLDGSLTPVAVAQLSVQPDATTPSSGDVISGSRPTTPGSISSAVDAAFEAAGPAASDANGTAKHAASPGDKSGKSGAERRRSEVDKALVESTSLLLDTTAQHKSHLFDLHCKICTGKMAPPPPPVPLPIVQSHPSVPREPPVIPLKRARLSESGANHESYSTESRSATSPVPKVSKHRVRKPHSHRGRIDVSSPPVLEVQQPKIIPLEPVDDYTAAPMKRIDDDYLVPKCIVSVMPPPRSDVQKTFGGGSFRPMVPTPAGRPVLLSPPTLITVNNGVVVSEPLLQQNFLAHEDCGSATTRFPSPLFRQNSKMEMDRHQNHRKRFNETEFKELLPMSPNDPRLSIDFTESSAHKAKRLVDLERVVDEKEDGEIDERNDSQNGSVTEPSPPLVEEYVWRGTFDMPGYYHFDAALVGVSGPFELLSRDLPSNLKIVGRIPPETVLQYVESLKGNSTKDVVVVRLAESPSQAHRAQYHGLFQNMLRKGKLSVVDTNKLPTVKDLYLMPLAQNEEPNEILLPFDGPGLPANRHDLILAIAIRRKEQFEMSSH